MLYFRTISPCIHGVCPSEEQGTGPRRWRQCRGHEWRALTVKMPRWEQRNCIVQQHRLLHVFPYWAFFFIFLNVWPWNLFHPVLLWLVRIRWEGYFYKRGGERARRRQVRFSYRSWVYVVVLAVNEQTGLRYERLVPFFGFIGVI